MSPRGSYPERLVRYTIVFLLRSWMYAGWQKLELWLMGEEHVRTCFVYHAFGFFSRFMFWAWVFFVGLVLIEALTTNSLHWQNRIRNRQNRIASRRRIQRIEQAVLKVLMTGEKREDVLLELVTAEMGGVIQQEFREALASLIKQDRVVETTKKVVEADREPREFRFYRLKAKIKWRPVRRLLPRLRLQPTAR